VGGKGDISPPPGNSHAEKNLGVLVNTLHGIVISICLQLLGAMPQTPIRALALDPAEGLPSPRPQVCPPPKQIPGYAPG